MKLTLRIAGTLDRVCSKSRAGYCLIVALRDAAVGNKWIHDSKESIACSLDPIALCFALRDLCLARALDRVVMHKLAKAEAMLKNEGGSP